MYAIRNKKTKEWVHGTDFRHSPPKQRTSRDKARTFRCVEEAEYALIQRECNKDYEIVKIKIVALE